MTKYYKVYLKYENFCTICTKVPFTKDLYREIITDKIIYPQSKNTNSKLTYDYLPNGLPRCFEISKSEVSDWLFNLNVEEYKYNLKRIEDIIIKSQKIEIDEKIVYKTIEKQPDKTIKKTLRKIKQR